MHRDTAIAGRLQAACPPIPLPNSVARPDRDSSRASEVFVGLGYALGMADNPRDVAWAIARAADDLLGWDSCALDLCDGREHAYSLLTMDEIGGERREVTTAYRDIEPGTMFHRVLTEGPLLVLREEARGAADLHLRPFGDASRPSLSLLFVPVRQSRATIGVFTIQSYAARHYDEDDLRLLQALADYGGGALARTFAEERLREAEAERARAMADLQRSNADLEQFAVAISHDLMEPLRMATGHVQLLQRRAGERLGADGRETLEHALDGTKRMRGMIMDLLNWSRVGAGESTMGRVDLGAVMKGVVDGMAPTIADASARVEIGALPAVTGDGAQLARLFQNLVGNGLKFRGDAPPHVRVDAVREGPAWNIRVADNGIGFAPEHAERIFGVFVRLHDRDAFPGTGMGLALCRRIAERHGGGIRAESSPGAGATFVVTLPAREGDA